MTTVTPLLRRVLKLRESDDACHLKPGFTAEQLAAKHKVSVAKIEAELAKGQKVEQEHTTDPTVARNIASQHIDERLDYYEVLERDHL